jgi:uncharacterized protein (TIGR00369 family)
MIRDRTASNRRLAELDEILDAAVAGTGPRSRYAERLGLPRPTGWEPGHVWCDWEVDPELLTPWGAVFGGYLAALADEFAGTAAVSVLEDGETFGTNDLRISPLRAIRSGPIRIEGRVIHRGRSTIHVEVEFRNEEAELMAKATAIQIVVHR